MNVDWIDELRGARSRLETARLLLENPTSTNLDDCAHLLEMANSRLLRHRTELRPSGGDVLLLGEARAFARSVQLIGRLLAWTRDYYAHQEQWIGALTAGYQAGGLASPVARPRHVWVRG